MLFIKRMLFSAAAVRIWCLLACIAAGSFFASGQGIAHRFSGRVTGTGGTALENVTITASPGDLKTTTNSSGYFSFDGAADSLLLTLTHIGYISRRIRAYPGRELSLSLADDNRQLDTVRLTLSTGYQEIPKERATGSFSQISSKQLSEQVSTTFIERLEALTGALSFDKVTGTSPALMVRGLSTVQGVRGPLIVLDNFPYEGSLDNINPNDIESITILKDAAAASIWGARAGNGVLVISTKKAKFNQPVKVDFSSSVSRISPPDLFRQPTLSPSDMVDLEQYLYGKGFYTASINSSAHPVLSPVVELLAAKASGKITSTAADAQLSALRNYDVRDEFNRYMYGTGVNQQYSFSVRGGSKDVSWLFSSGYDRDASVLSATYDRLNLRLTNNWKPFRNFQAGAGINFTGSKRNSGKPAYNDLANSSGELPLYTRFADEQGNPLPVGKTYAQSYLETAGNGRLLDWSFYPLTDYQHNRTNTGLQEIVANLNLNYKLFAPLSIDVKYQFEQQQTAGDVIQDADSYYTRDLVNRYTQIPATGPVVYKIPPGAIIDKSDKKLLAHNVRAQANFSQTWGNHELSAIAGTEVRNVSGINLNSRIYGMDSENLRSASVDYANTYPLQVGSAAFIPDKASYGTSTNRFVSGYVNAAYTFMQRYTFSASARRDASNLFGVSANDKWTPLWSAGLAWSLSDEPFYKFAPLPELKLRATYGFSGNTDPSRTAVTTASLLGLSPYTLLPTARIEDFANVELKWERVKTVNFGADFSTAGRRISGSLEYYIKKGLDLFGFEDLDYTGGAGASITKNVAKIRGTGIDLELQTINTTGFVGWRSRINLSTNHNRIVDYFVTSNRASNFVIGTRVSGVKGSPVYSIYSYKWAGLDPATGDPMGYVNGSPSKDYNALTGTAATIDDLTLNGSALPQIYGSFANTVSAGPFSVSAAISFKLDYYFHRDAMKYSTLFARTAYAEYADRWQKPGDEMHTNVPSLVYPVVSARDGFYSASEINVLKADHVRLQYITAACELTKKNWRRLPLDRLNISLNATNLGVLWTANKLNIDPENQGLAPQKTYSLTLKTNL